MLSVNLIGQGAPVEGIAAGVTRTDSRQAGGG
jgi:hypothetical protein